MQLTLRCSITKLNFEKSQSNVNVDYLSRPPIPGEPSGMLGRLEYELFEVQEETLNQVGVTSTEIASETSKDEELTQIVKNLQIGEFDERFTLSYGVRSSSGSQEPSTCNIIRIA